MLMELGKQSLNSIRLFVSFGVMRYYNCVFLLFFGSIRLVVQNYGRNENKNNRVSNVVRMRHTDPTQIVDD